MKLSKMVLTCLAIAFFMIAVFCLVKIDSLNSKVNYHATHLCELQRLSILRAIVPSDTHISKLAPLCESERFECNKETNSVHIEFSGVQACPKSGRPYCGFTANVNTNKVVNITSAYPCH